MEFRILRIAICIFGIIILSSSDEYTELEAKYVECFGNDPKNPKGLWPEAKDMLGNETLAEFCSKVHFMNEGTSYEVIDEAFVHDGILRFPKSNGTFQPMAITVVNYYSYRWKNHYYMTKGTTDDCILWLEPLNANKTEFRLVQSLCDCFF